MNEMTKAIWPGWETVRLLGRGSFGAVYEIERDNYGHKEKAALKVISIPDSASDIDALMSDGYDEESITERFNSFMQDIVREYSMMADMKGCANIVYCDDWKSIQHDNGPGWDIFIKMELLDVLPRVLGKTVSDEQIVKIGTDICSALVFCEERSVLHRDIKPQNIFVAPDGTYKLGDFGIAKTAERTTSGTKTGTYPYMAPEVYNNQPYGGKADIYSLGLVLYWLLNERRTPFLPLPPVTPTVGEEEAARKRRFGGEALPPPAHGSAALKRIVLKACAFDPKDRYQSAEELLHDLESLDNYTAQIKENNADQSKRSNGEASIDYDDEQTISVFEHNNVARIEQENEITHTEYMTQRPLVIETINNRKKKTKSFLFAIGLISAVLLVGFLIYFFLEWNNKQITQDTRARKRSIPSAQTIIIEATAAPRPDSTIQSLEIRYKFDNMERDDATLGIGEELPLYAAIIPDDIEGTVMWRVDDEGKDAFQLIVEKDNNITVKCLGYLPEGCAGVYLYAEINNISEKCMLHVTGAVEEKEAVETTHAQPELSASVYDDALRAYTNKPFSSAYASSAFVEDNIVFRAEYAINESINRPWVEGKDGNGIGETLTLCFSEETSVQVIGVTLGYARSSEFYRKNNRPSRLRFQFSDGSSVECDFEDVLTEQKVLLDRPVATTSIEITILDVFLGNDNDTCIYLVRAYG